MREALILLMRGHGIRCVLLGCKTPYWHGANFPTGPDAPWRNQ